MADAVSPWWRCPNCGASLNEPLGALGASGPTCPQCQRIAHAPDHPYYGTVGAVEYDFDDVAAAERAEASDLLVGAGVPYRWEDGYRLLVGPESEEKVDTLFGHQGDEPETDDGDEPEADDGDEPAAWAADEESADALARLFDAADRLRHHPFDEDAAAELADAAGVVLIAPVPFAMNRVLWATAGTLARQLLDLVEAKAEREDVVAGADALRAVLRDHV